MKALIQQDPDTEEGYDAENFALGEKFVGEQVANEAEAEYEEPQEQFVLPPQEPCHREAGSYSMPPDQWAWV